MKKKNRLQMLAALLIATLSMAVTSPIAAKANEEYNVGQKEEVSAETGRIYYLKNSHGDVIGQMDENGTVLTSYAYNAFGEQVSAVVTKGEQKSTANRFLYAGEQYDETSGFYYLRARHYDVKAGRFTQEDTYLGDGRNLYAYATQSQMQKLVESGQAPKNIDRVDKQHVLGQQPHIHFKDGTIHDAHRGIPSVSNNVREWLTQNGWEIKE